MSQCTPGSAIESLNLHRVEKAERDVLAVECADHILLNLDILIRIPGWIPDDGHSAVQGRVRIGHRPRRCVKWNMTGKTEAAIGITVQDSAA